MAITTYAKPEDVKFDLIHRWVIPGDPVAYQRTKSRGRRRYTPAKTRNWQKKAIRIYRSSCGVRELSVPVAVKVVSVKARPKSMRRVGDPDGRLLCPVVPDGDNVLKNAVDALVKSDVITDDDIVVFKSVWTLYAAIDEEPRVEVELLSINITDGYNMPRWIGAREH